MQEESTTPDLEEVVRQLIEAANRRDSAAATAMFAPDGVWDPSSMGLAGPVAGREVMARVLKDWLRPFEDYEVELEEVHDLGNGVAFGVLLERGRFRGGSGAVAPRYAIVAICADRLIERWTSYTEIDQARAAAERLVQERGSAVSKESTTPDAIEFTRNVLFAATSEEHLEGVLERFAPNAVWDATALGPGAEAFEGRDAIGTFLEEWWSLWDEHDHYVEEIADLGGGVIFTIAREDGRIKGSEGCVEQTLCHVGERADGLVVRHSVYKDPDEARAAAERLAQERG
jgi:ketosteroid isomerase-like protein